MIPGDSTNSDIIFGPVPSRRFGMSLGVNNIPSKTCSYSCIYCQVGRTDDMTIERRKFYSTEDIREGVMNRLSSTDSKVDVITFVPDGEPTLDINLADHIRSLKDTGADIAVITNSSLLWREDVREDLMEADIVSVKVDSVNEETWRKIDRPHGSLYIDRVLEGIKEFSRSFKGRLLTETMLVKGVNDNERDLEGTVKFLNTLNAGSHHITAPIRPPAECDVEIPDEKTFDMAYMAFSRDLDNVSMITGKETGSFGSTGDLKMDLIATCRVHPMREESVLDMVKRSGGSLKDVEDLVNNGDLMVRGYRGTRFFRTIEK